MALDKLTIIDGGGLSTTSDYRVGVITATKFVGPIEGSITSADATFTGNVSIGGTLTYEDVTNIDSVGLITARAGVNITGGNLTLGDSSGITDSRIELGDAGDLELFHTGSESKISNANSNLIIQCSANNIELQPKYAEKGLRTIANGATELYHDGNLKFETTSSGVSIPQDLDVNGHTNLDNVSIAGVTTFNGGSTFGSSINLGGELNFTGNGHKYIDVATLNGGNTLTIRHQDGGSYETAAYFDANGGAYLQFNGSTKFATTNTGGTVTGDLLATGLFKNDTAGEGLHNTATGGKFYSNDSNDTRLEHGSNTQTKLTFYSSSNTYRGAINGDANGMMLLTAGSSEQKGVRCITDGATELFHSGTKKFETASNGVTLNDGLLLDNATNAGRDVQWQPTNNRLAFLDNTKATFGNGADLSIYHNGSHSYIEESGTGNLYIRSSNTRMQSSTGEDQVLMAEDGSVELFHDGTKMAYTSSSGFDVTNGDLRSHLNIKVLNDNQKILIGGGNDLEIFFDGTHSKIDHKPTSGSLFLASDSLVLSNSGMSQYYLQAAENGAVYLNHSGNTKLATSSGGVTVTGNVDCDGIRMVDDDEIRLGASDDLKIFHDSSANNNVIEGHTGSLNLRNYNVNSTDIVLSARRNIILQTNLNELGLQCLANGATELFYDGGTYQVPKLKTTAIGITVDGEITSSQDYPNVRPTLDFNFAATKKLDPRIKYTRTGMASFINEKGLLEIVNSNVPRFDHDPVTRECKGLLIEGSRTNLISYSNAPGMSSPNLGGNPQINDSVNNITLPTGEKGTVRRYLANAGGGGGRWGGYSGNSGVAKTGSVWVRTVSGTTNAVLDIADGGGKTVSITEEWQRVTTTYTPNNAYEFFDIYFASPTTIYYWGVQIEESAFMTSYIPTFTTTGTRGADFVKVEGEEFAEFYNDATEHTTVMIGKRLGDTNTDGRLYTISDGTASNVAPDWDFNDDTKLRLSTNVGGNNQMLQELNPFNERNDEFKIAAGMAVNNQIGVVNGTAIAAADTSCLMPTGVDRLFFGLRGNGNNQGSLAIKRFMFYPKRLPDSQLVTLTS